MKLQLTGGFVNAYIARRSPEIYLFCSDGGGLPEGEVLSREHEGKIGGTSKVETYPETSVQMRTEIDERASNAGSDDDGRFVRRCLIDVVHTTYG